MTKITIHSSLNARYCLLHGNNLSINHWLGNSECDIIRTNETLS